MITRPETVDVSVRILEERPDMLCVTAGTSEADVEIDMNPIVRGMHIITMPETLAMQKGLW